MIGVHVVNQNYIDGILDGADDEDSGEKSTASSGDLDALFDDVVEFVLSTGNTSTSYVQRKFSVGFNRAARIMDQLEEQGIFRPNEKWKTRNFGSTFRILILLSFTLQKGK